MLLSIGKPGIPADGQKGWVQMVSALTFHAEKATLKLPAAPIFLLTTRFLYDERQMPNAGCG
jgi:hypothetical protein